MFREVRLCWLVLLVFGFGCVPALAQRESKDESYVTLSPELMNRELTAIDNHTFKLTDYGDKVIVINIFASWCGPCRMNLMDLIDLKKSYSAHPIEVIGIVSSQADSDVEVVRRFAREQEVNFQVVWDNGDFANTLQEAINARSVIPQTFVIKEGKIFKHFQGYNQSKTPQYLRESLDEVATVNKPSPPQ